MQRLPRSNEPDIATLLSKLGRECSRSVGKHLEPTGLRSRHMSAMLALRDGPRSQRDLARALTVHATKLVTLLNELETDGLTLRRRDPEDRRKHTVSLSELGRARLAALDVAKHKLDEVLLCDFTVAQRALLGSLLERIAANLEEEGPLR